MSEKDHEETVINALNLDSGGIIWHLHAKIN